MENKIYVEKDFNPNYLQLLSIINDWKSSGDRQKLIDLKKYYNAKNPTALRKPIGDREYDSRIISGYPKYITTLINGYFLGGNSITLTFRDNNGEEVKSINRYNDEKFINQEIGKNMSIFGHALEQIYLEEDTGNFRYKCVDPINCIPLFNDDIEEELNSVIKFKETTIYDEYGKKQDKMTIEFYSKYPYKEFKLIDSNLVSQEEDEINIFNDVPFIFYENPDCSGDYEGVLTLIDAYDEALANNSNLFNYFNDALTQ